MLSGRRARRLTILFFAAGLSVLISGARSTQNLNLSDFRASVRHVTAVGRAVYTNEVQFAQWNIAQTQLALRPPALSPREYANYLASNGAADPHNHSGMETRLAERVEAEEGYAINSHESGEGPNLQPDLDEHSQVWLDAQTCPSGSPLKRYDVVAIPITMVLNRWGDRDPGAFMYALRDHIPAIRAQEARASDESTGFGVSLGLGSDAIQPLTLRGNPGDCIQIQFSNDINQLASFHIHGADLVLSESGLPALSTNPDSIALPGETLSLEWYINPDYYGENTHYAHSHGPQARYLVGHGLFGAFIVEPPGSSYFDTRSAEPLCEGPVDGEQVCSSSWDAIISPGDGSADFREFSLFYHEIGNAKFTPEDKDGIPNPIIDPLVNSYKPNGRAINYRSESFWRRLSASNEAVGIMDEAEAYSSYAFGEPAMPIPLSYVGDPIKFRLLHAGSETVHVPHLHGGGIQWQRQQDMGKDGAADYTGIDAGLKKDFAHTMPSSGNDSQTIAPSETYELEIACGSGGCQQTVGDFLFHCHVASHYISGMWHFWRVYNTRQAAPSEKTDQLGLVAELPDREGGIEPAIESPELIGRTVTFAGQRFTVTAENLTGLVESQIPPAGLPNGLLDAAVWNWSRSGDLYLGEPESDRIWPNYEASAPGERPVLMFDPVSGKLAFPHLRPHLGQRPPFAPNHGPAPFLEPLEHDRGKPAPPGSNGEYSLCPAGAPVRTYKVHAIQTDIPVTTDQTDGDGMIFVVKEYEELARSDPYFKTPLAIRANQGDCVDIILVNELEETGDPGELSKTNIHIHFVQFDTQASDGVISGASYEQSPRPFYDPGMSVASVVDVPAGAAWISVEDSASFHVGSAVGIGMDQQLDVFETAIIASIDGNTLYFEQPLERGHRIGERVSVEYVRYRWFVARQNGAIYFHDHVDALKRWGHGLFGALIAEPTNSTWHDPISGEPILSGTQADIRLPANQEVLPGLSGSFREFVLFMTDHNPLTGSAFNLRAEPLFGETARGSGPPELTFSSVTYGDPHTPVLRAYVGDPVMLRLLTTAAEEVHPFHITGHTFRQERFQASSAAITVFGVGISERFNAFLGQAGGLSAMPGDYFYYNGAQRHFMEGSWGIFRVHDTLQSNLQPLPNLPAAAGNGFPRLTFTGNAPVQANNPGNPCPEDVSGHRRLFVSAIDIPLVFNPELGLGIPGGRVYVLTEDVRAIHSGEKLPEPLVVRANAGECLTVTFSNQSSQPASFHLDALAVDPVNSLGINLGFNRGQVAAPGSFQEYRFYAGSELGAVLIRDFGNPIRNAREGLYGALIVEPAGSIHLNPYTGKPLPSGSAAVVMLPDGGFFREFVLLYHDADPDIGLFLMPYDEEVNRVVGVNYRAEPLGLRLANFGVLLDADPILLEDMPAAAAVFSAQAFDDPWSPVFETFAGDPVRFRIISGYSEQVQVFSLEGHQWSITPGLPGSDVVSTRYLPPTGVLNVEISQSGGPRSQPGDYLWSNHRLPFLKAGMWGLFRVLAPDALSQLIPIN
jgi:hypothetical protein